MRKIRAALAAATMTIAAGTLLAGPAQAAQDGIRASNCYYLWHDMAWDGNVRAYDATHCTELLGREEADDPNWADQQGGFRGSDNDKATSLLNTGSEAGGINNVQFFQASDYRRGTGCLAWGENYVDDLRDNHFDNGVSATNNISSHRWSSACANPWT